MPVFFNTIFRKLNSGYLTGAKATGANSYGLRSTVYNCSYLTDVGLPSSVCAAVRVGNGVTENNALATDTAFCHNDTSLCTKHIFYNFLIQFHRTAIIIPQRKTKCNSFF